MGQSPKVYWVLIYAKAVEKYSYADNFLMQQQNRYNIVQICNWTPYPNCAGSNSCFNRLVLVGFYNLSVFTHGARPEPSFNIKGTLSPSSYSRKHNVSKILCYPVEQLRHEKVTKIVGERFCVGSTSISGNTEYHLIYQPFVVYC